MDRAYSIDYDADTHSMDEGILISLNERIGGYRHDLSIPRASDRLGLMYKGELF